MAARLYSVSFDNVAVTAAQDFFELTAATDHPIALYGIFIGQSSDFGDAQEELLRWQVIRGNTTSGSGGGTNPTPRPLSSGDSAATFTCEINNTTVASAGTAVVLHAGVFNVRSGIEMWIPPEAIMDTNATVGKIVVRLMAAPADSLTMTGTLYVVEY